MFNFIKQCHVISQSGPFAFPPVMYESSCCFTFPPVFDIDRLFEFNHSTRHVVVFHFGTNSHFLRTSNANHLGLIDDSCIVLYEESVQIIFALLHCFAFALLSCWGPLCTLNTSSLPDIACEYFSKLWLTFFVFLTMNFEEQNV